MAQVAVVGPAHRPGKSPAHAQQYRRDQRNQTERMIEDHQAPDPRISQEPLGAPEQPPVQAAVDQWLSVDFLGDRVHRRRVLRIPVLDERAGLCDHLRDELHGPAGVVGNVLTDGGLTRERLQLPIDISGGGHDRIGPLERNELQPLAIENGRRRVGGAEVDADPCAHHLPTPRSRFISASFRKICQPARSPKSHPDVGTPAESPGQPGKQIGQSHLPAVPAAQRRERCLGIRALDQFRARRQPLSRQLALHVTGGDPSGLVTAQAFDLACIARRENVILARLFAQGGGKPHRRLHR